MHYGSIYGQGQFSMNEELPFRCSAEWNVSRNELYTLSLRGWAPTWLSKYTAVEQARKASS